MLEKVKKILRSREEERLQRELVKSQASVKRLRKQLKKAESDPFPADQLVWIFGTARVGSTWLSSMMSELSGWERWNEPLVGQMFGAFFEQEGNLPQNRERSDFIFRNPKIRSAAIRAFLLAALAEKFDGAPMAVIKEPNGSRGSPLLMEALPESRMIFLVRDPRDVVASGLDAGSEGGWRYKLAKRGGQEPESPEEIIESRSSRYNHLIGNSKRAYEAHRGPKVLIRYEELRADTLGTMRYLYTTLGIDVDERKLAKSVEKHAWESIPEHGKGPGKSRRKAMPGGWREDLTPAQARRVEEITAPLLEEFYPDIEAKKRPPKAPKPPTAE